MVYAFDSSFVAALIIPDEKNPRTKELKAKIKDEDEKYAPQLIWYEITNIFKNLIRRKRYTYDEALLYFEPLAAIHFVEDNEAGINYSKKLLELCEKYNLTSYDAAYLELAERKRAVLCTLDEDLQAAAKKHGVAVLD